MTGTKLCLLDRDGVLNTDTDYLYQIKDEMCIRDRYSDCPTCSGSGRVQSKEAIALEIKRRIRTLLKKQGSAKEILVVAHPLTTAYLQQHQLKDWSRELACRITVEADPAPVSYTHLACRP